MVAVQVKEASISTSEARCEPPASQPSQTDSQNECSMLLPDPFCANPQEDRKFNLEPLASFPGVRGSVPRKGWRKTVLRKEAPQKRKRGARSPGDSAPAPGIAALTPKPGSPR